MRELKFLKELSGKFSHILVQDLPGFYLNMGDTDMTVLSIMGVVTALVIIGIGFMVTRSIPAAVKVPVEASTGEYSIAQ